MTRKFAMDLTSVGEQIAAAVKQAVEQATDKLLAANLKDTKDEELKGEEVKVAETKVVEIKGEEVKVADTKDEKVKDEEVNGEEVKGEEVKGEEVKAASKQDFSFDIRGQILANARSLWKTARSYQVEHNDPDGEPGPSPPSPPFSIIVYGTKGEFFASAQLEQPQDNRHVHQTAFIESECASSVDEALQNLLHTTAELLVLDDEFRHAWRTVLNVEDNLHLEGLGWMHRATGGCDRCDEVVWT
ncbi:hypothetical protein LTR56_025196 [Elasticomyces elasticus]|nr:hypothetical protein LTR56_025196 [Elasticomyces elasticus]KAK3649261.1 hypothetical protein LTR22_012990 [Elasticomyces elasticus]KAK4928205.1 hypothetical protein LTR49_005143 [Elasticomyces elasticus]KAK5765959.1 hypothetical protein LTS12_003966 [Elasticomyces elasticus]